MEGILLKRQMCIRDRADADHSPAQHNFDRIKCIFLSKENDDVRSVRLLCRDLCKRKRNQVRHTGYSCNLSQSGYYIKNGGALRRFPTEDVYKRQNLYNSIACIDGDGTILGVYRKTHIPDCLLYTSRCV